MTKLKRDDSYTFTLMLQRERERERERERVCELLHKCVSVFVFITDCSRKRDIVGKGEREVKRRRDSMCVSVYKRERERERGEPIIVQICTKNVLQLSFDSLNWTAGQPFEQR